MSFMRPELLPKGAVPPKLPGGAPNPLKVFASKSKPIAPAFRALDQSKPVIIKEIESREQWLAPDKLDPKFGITGDTREVLIRRSFRRLESSNLFKPEESSLSEIVPEHVSPDKKYVLVEKSRLNELARLESILREEKEKLREQTVGVLSNYHIDARIPMPATRVAVRTLAEAEQRKLTGEISDLYVAWHNYSTKNNYDRVSSVMNKHSYVDKAPAALRAMKLNKLVHDNAEKMLKMERDSMMFEDDLSYLNLSYAKAQERIWDYDRYYVLATRYGHMSEEEYSLDDRPGRRYYLRAVDGALKFQQIWGMYWAIQRIRYRRGAMGFQKIIRGFLAWRKYHPLIIFRLKYGKRSYYEFCLHRWKRYNAMLKMCKVGIQWLLDREWIKKTFYAWQEYRILSKEEKIRKAKQIFAKVMSSGVLKCFQALKSNAVRNRYIKIKMRRNIGFPQFDMWCDYVDAVKHQKKIHRAATKLAATVKMFLARKPYKAKRKVAKIFGLLIKCRVVLIRKRKKALGESFKLWEMLETEALTNVRTAGERRRVAKCQEKMTEREKEESARLRRHLRGGHGKMQIRLASRAILRSRQVELAKETETLLKSTCSHTAKSMAKHDYNIVDAPFLTCVDPMCTSTFVTYAQYHLHHLHNPRHCRGFAAHKAKLLHLMHEENPDGEEDDKEEAGTVSRIQMVPFGGHKPSAQEKKLQEQREEEIELLETGEGDVDGKNAATDEERQIITVSDFHLLLLEPGCRALLRDSYERLMLMARPGELKRSDVNFGGKGTNKKSLAELMAEMSDSGSEAGDGGKDPEDKGEGAGGDSPQNELDEHAALIPRAGPGASVATGQGINKGAIAPEVTTPDLDTDSDDEEARELEKLKKREDPVYRNLKNAVELYDAIQTWRKQPSDSYTYKSQAILILDKFLSNPVETKIEDPTEDVEGYEELYDLSGYFSDESDDTVIAEEKAVIHKNRAAYRKAQRRAQRRLLATVTKVDFTLCKDHHGADDLSWLSSLKERLESLKNCTHRGFFKPMRLNRTCLRMFFGMQGQPYNIWTDEAVLPGDFFDKLELQCFNLLYQHVTHRYFKFHDSPEYKAYKDWEALAEERRLFDMYVRAKDLRLKEYEKWSREDYYPKHMAIYRQSEATADSLVVQEADHIVDLACSILADERVLQKGYAEQALHENITTVALEALEWTEDILFDEWWDVYVNAAVKSMLEIDLIRSKLTVFAGLREKSGIVKKKLLVDVDLNATSTSLLDMLNDDAPATEEMSSQGDTADPGEDHGKDKGVEESKVKDATTVPGINVINYATSNHARWQAEKAAAKKAKEAGLPDPRGDPPRHFPMIVKSEREWNALVVIQRRFRGVLSRNRARREFAARYVKKWDANYGACYYCNTVTEGTSWQAPSIYRHLYPGRKW